MHRTISKHAVSLIIAADLEAHKRGSDEATRFLSALDELLEAPNLRVRQIPLVAELLEYAFAAGMRSR